jgi:glutaredoxin
MNSGGAPVITFYWRPGCGFCRRLHADLVATGLAFEMRNIWEDADAAAYVRSVARGHETVPTVSIGADALVNPPIARILDLVQSSS